MSDVDRYREIVEAVADRRDPATTAEEIERVCAAAGRTREEMGRDILHAHDERLRARLNSVRADAETAAVEALHAEWQTAGEWKPDTDSDWSDAT